MIPHPRHLRPARLLAALACFAALTTALHAQLPPVKVFLLAGQSNMQGHGQIDKQVDGVEVLGTLRDVVTKNPTAYGHLLDENGDWVVRGDVWTWVAQGVAGKPENDTSIMGYLEPKFGAGTDRFGPELGFGKVLGDYYSEPVVLVKTNWGGASLFGDFRPPSAVAKRGGEVGLRYTRMLSAYQEALLAISTQFPGRAIELVGFGWHQGYNDKVNANGSAEYLENIEDFINDVRAALNAPGLPFVIATTGMEPPVNLTLVESAQLAMEPRENVTVINTRPLYKDPSVSPTPSQGYHWNGHGETYYLIGSQMGDAMQALLATPESDTTQPAPNPLTFQTNPTPLNSATVTMSANAATDINSVEYYFTCTAGGGNDSGWQYGLNYTDTGLSPSTLYTYTVKARDRAALGNETTPSAGVSITTPIVDIIAPTPDPLTFASAPAATGRASLTMTATTASDLHGVEYYFEETSGNPGGQDSGWQDSPTYTNNFLDPAATYSYRVRARDKAVTPNMTAWSASAPGTTAALVPGVIYWRGARDTTAASDIVTEGTLHQAKHGAGGSLSPNAPPVTCNTVTFQPGPILGVGRNDNVCAASAPAELGALLDNLSWSGNNFTLTGLAPGGQYLLQVFSCDVRVASDDQGTWGDVQTPKNEVILSRYNDVANGVYGQFTTGTFTANGTTQTISTPGSINAYQVRLLSGLVEDTTPPDPATMSWASPPAVAGGDITMTATTATDTSGVEYYFDETTGNPGGTDSGWQDSPTYTDTGLSPSTTYTYTVTARDKSANQNTTDASAPASATTAEVDTTAPPTPGFASGPTANSSSQITMTATVVTDPEGSGVEYQFTETTGNSGGTSSAWQTSPTYTDTGLAPSTPYSYTVKARDTASSPNASAPSVAASATTPAAPVSSGTTVWNINMGSLINATDNYHGAAVENTTTSSIWNSITNANSSSSTLADATGSTSAGVTLAMTGGVSTTAVQTTINIASKTGATGDEIFIEFAKASDNKTPFTVSFGGLNPSSTYALVVYSDWYFNGSGLNVTQTVGTGLAGTFVVNSSGVNISISALAEDTNSADVDGATNWSRFNGLKADGSGNLAFLTGGNGTTTSSGNIPLSGLQLIQLADVSPPTDYATWAGIYSPADLSNSSADNDGDGLTNEEERIFGLDPTSGASANPIVVPLNASAGTFSYTRRDPTITSLTYTVWTSSNLQPEGNPGGWTVDSGAVQAAGTPDSNGVQTVAVTLSPSLLTAPKLFVRVQAN